MADTATDDIARTRAAAPPRSASPEERVSPGPLLLTTVVCLLFAVAGHGVLWWAYARGAAAQPVPWQPVVGISLAGVAVAAFGGFFVASHRARVAIAASFLLTFLVLLTYVLTIDGLAGTTRAEGVKQLFDDFRWVVAAIITFYFGSETVIGATKVRAVSRAPEAAASVSIADEDLPPQQQ